MTMSDLDSLFWRHRVWSHHLEKVCNELGANELEFRPMPDSNSAAWILRHIISGYREFVELAGPERAAELLGELPLPPEAELAKMPFSRIFALVDAHREAFQREIELLRETKRLESTCPAGEGKTWLDLIHSVTSHEIYHCGQLAYLVRVLQQKAKASREE
jgi:uncharacterized damage-inducible protein DinB